MKSSSNKTVLVTGATGFIGLNVVKLFSSQGWNVLAMVHSRVSEELEQLQNVEIIKADVTDEKSVLTAIGDRHVDVVAHVAGLAKDIGYDEIYRRVNFEPIKYLSKIPTEKIIYMSSTDVYGIKDFNGTDEENTPFEAKPINPYPKYKIISEKWLNENLPKSKYVLIRPAAVYGEGDKTLENRVIEFLKGSPFIVHFGKWCGKNRWPLANVKYVAAAVYCAAVTNDFDGKAINIIDEKHTSIDEYYREVAKKCCPDKKFKTVVFPFWFGKVLGFISTVFSNVLKLKEPIFDPTYYAVHHVSSNLDFDGTRLQEVLKILKERFDIEINL